MKGDLKMDFVRDCIDLFKFIYFGSGALSAILSGLVCVVGGIAIVFSKLVLSADEKADLTLNGVFTFYTKFYLIVKGFLLAALYLFFTFISMLPNYSDIFPALENYNQLFIALYFYVMFVINVGGIFIGRYLLKRSLTAFKFNIAFLCTYVFINVFNIMLSAFSVKYIAFTVFYLCMLVYFHHRKHLFVK